MIHIVTRAQYDHTTGRKVAPAVGLCACGRYVELDGFTCPCDCGRDYNGSGQELAPRAQWGEETGETATEILQAEAEGFRHDYAQTY